MTAVTRLLVLGSAVGMLLGSLSELAQAQTGFDNGDLKGVYAFYSTGTDREALVGVIEFDAKGEVAAGNGKLFLPDPAAAEPLASLLAVPFELVEGFYQVNPDGTGTTSMVADVQGFAAPLDINWTFVITQAKAITGVAEEYRWVGEQLSLVGNVLSGYAKKLPRAVVPNLDQ